MSWDEGIKNSEFFLIIGTESYFQDAVCYCQAEYAKQIKKPFRILLKEGVDLPFDFLKGVKDYKIAKWNSKKDIGIAFGKLFNLE